MYYVANYKLYYNVVHIVLAFSPQNVTFSAYYFSIHTIMTDLMDLSNTYVTYLHNLFILY